MCSCTFLNLLITTSPILGNNPFKRNNCEYFLRDFHRPIDRRTFIKRGQCVRARNSGPFQSNNYDYYDDFVDRRNWDKNPSDIEFETDKKDNKTQYNRSKIGPDITEDNNDIEKEEGLNIESMPNTNFSETNGDIFSEKGTRKDNDLAGSVTLKKEVSTKLEELSEDLEKSSVRSRKPMVRRSNLLAKQVISVQSALSLGYVSQLWVDTNLWEVLAVEVRPSLLSGEVERFLLEDIYQVGDVILVQDESVRESDHKMIGLDTLVGYSVVTPNRQNVGKVRGYSFNINTGVVEYLELDSFGISIVPASLVSTYCLFVEDVIEVTLDTIVVHEAAVSRVQRLTKGIWDSQKAERFGNTFGDYPDFESETRSPRSQNRQKNKRSQKFSSATRDDADIWDLPMDY